jgi:hypothetical protein
MIGLTLQFARDEGASESRKQVDLTAIVRGVVDEMNGAGFPVFADSGTHPLQVPARGP